MASSSSFSNDNRSSGSVHRSSRVRQQIVVATSSSSSFEESSTSITSHPPTLSMLSSSSNHNTLNRASESSPSKDKKNQHSFCLCFHTSSPSSCWKRSLPTTSTSRRRQQQQRLFSPSQSHPHHPSSLLLPKKWRQRFLLCSMGFFTFILGWRMLLLHGELLLTQQEDQYHYQQQRLLDFFAGHDDQHRHHQHQPIKNWAYSSSLRGRLEQAGHLRGEHQTPPPSQQQQQQRHHRRQQRTRPPPLNAAAAQQYLQPTEYQLQTEYDDDDDNNSDWNVVTPSSSFLSSRNHTYTSTSRIVVVGLLSSSWGISLALHLQKHYGISHILGVDEMFPNVQPYRMALTRRYEVLARHVPNVTLWTPPTTQRPDHSIEMALANELRDFQPTHVVYLSPTVSLDRVLQSYHLEDVDRNHAVAQLSSIALPWNVTARLFDIRHRVQSLRQLLQAIRMLYTNDKDSSHDFPLGRRRQEGVSPKPQPAPPRILVASAAASCSLLPQHYQLDQVLVNTYSQQYGIEATHVLVPPLYGTWLDDHDPLHELIHDVLEDSVLPSPGTTINTTAVDWVDHHAKRLLPHHATLARYLHIDDLLQVVTKLLQQPSPTTTTKDRHRPARNKMMVLSPDTSWESLHRAIREIVVSGSRGTHEHDPTSTAIGDNTKHTYNSSQSSVNTTTNVQQQRVVDMLAWKYLQAYPWRDPATYVANNSSHWITNKLPVEEQLPDYAHLPCACECSFLNKCAEVPTAFDESVVMASQQATEGARSAVYTVNWDLTLTSLAPIPLSDNMTAVGQNPALEAMLASITAITSRIAFISDQSPLAKRYMVDDASGIWNETRNGLMEENGWKLVCLKQNRLTAADRLLPKIAPGRLFAVTVNKAMYVAYRKIDRAPVLPALTFLMDHMVDSKRQRGRSRAISLTSSKGGNSQSVRYVYQEPSPSRRAALFAQEHILNAPSTSSLQKVARQLWWSNSTEPKRRHRQRQMSFYQHVMRLTQNTGGKKSNRHRQQPNPSRVSFQWVDTAIMVHNLHLTAARNLRCEWYGEHLSWRDDDDDQPEQLAAYNFTTTRYQQKEGMEELSLAFLIVKHRMEGRLGRPLLGDESWSPYFDLSRRARQKGEALPPRELNGAGQEIFLRVLGRPMDEPSAGQKNEGDDEDENDR